MLLLLWDCISRRREGKRKEWDLAPARTISRCYLSALRELRRAPPRVNGLPGLVSRAFSTCAGDTQLSLRASGHPGLVCTGLSPVRVHCCCSVASSGASRGKSCMPDPRCIDSTSRRCCASCCDICLTAQYRCPSPARAPFALAACCFGCVLLRTAGLHRRGRGRRRPRP